MHTHAHTGRTREGGDYTNTDFYTYPGPRSHLSGAAPGLVLTSSPAFRFLTFVPDWSRALWLARCPRPRPPSPPLRAHQDVIRERGEVCRPPAVEQDLHNGPLCARTFLVKQAQTQAASLDPRGRDPGGRAQVGGTLWAGRAGGLHLGRRAELNVGLTERALLSGDQRQAQVSPAPCSWPGWFNHAASPGENAPTPRGSTRSGRFQRVCVHFARLCEETRTSARMRVVLCYFCCMVSALLLVKTVVSMPE